ncbi:MAG: hypothetical protein MK212_18150 [Saprospiraceae bacterium]|nr:hypothetical protein [Saprospiraceae bacterium]
MKIAKYLQLLSLATMGFLYSCSSSETIQTTNYKVESPYAKLDEPFNEFELDVVKGDTFRLDNGTQLIVDPNALVDAEGKAVTGTATIQYREFHDAVDVLYSGIPMDFKDRNMQTAGMFELRAQQNGNTLQMAEGKGIKVKMASYEAGTDYNFFALDEEKGWEFVDYVAPEANADKEILRKKIAKLEKKMNRKQKPKEMFVFDYAAILDVVYKDNWSDIIANKNNPTVSNKAKKYGLSWLGISYGNYIKYKGNAYMSTMILWKKHSKRSFPSWVRKGEISNFKLEKQYGNMYKLTVSTKNGSKTFSAQIEAVMPLKYLFEKSASYWKKNWKEGMKEIAKAEEKIRIEYEKEQARLKMMADVYRSFKVEGFGIYNYDKLMKEEDGILITANFEMEGVDELKEVFCLTDDNKTVIQYPHSNWESVVLLPNNAARFVSILGDGKVGIYSAKAYQDIDFDQLRNSSKPTHKFELVKVLDAPDSKDALRAILNNEV